MPALCTWSAMAAQMLALAQPIGPTDAEMVDAGTQHELQYARIAPKLVKVIETDPCLPPERPCC